MTDISSSDWKELDAENTQPSPNGIQGGYSPSQVAPILRAMRGAIKRDYVQSNAMYTTTGATNVYALTYAAAPAAYTKGVIYRFYAHAANTGACSLNINNLGAKSILSQQGAALTASQIVTNRMVEVVYNGTAFELLSNQVQDPKFLGDLNTSGNIFAAGNLSVSGGNAYINSGGNSHLWYQNNGTGRAVAYYAPGPNNLWALNLYNETGTFVRSMSFGQDGNFNVNGTINATGSGYFGSEIGVGAARYYPDGNISFNGDMAAGRGVNLAVALDNKAPKANPSFTGIVTMPTAAGTNEFSAGNGDAASYSTHNIRFKGWYGLGMLDHTNTVNGFYDFRLGKWDVKNGFYRNGVSVAYNDGGQYNMSINGSSGTLRNNENGTPMKFNWNGQGGQPDWLWGGFNGADMYVYSPSNFTVRNTAQLGGYAASEYPRFSYSGNQAETNFPIGQTLLVYAAGVVSGRREYLPIYLHSDSRYYTLGAGSTGTQLIGGWRQVGNMGVEWAMYQRVV